MIEGLPWPAQLGVAGLGWAITGYFIWSLFTGRVVTRREADVYLTRAEKAETNLSTLISTNAEMTAVGHLQKAVIDAAIKTRNNNEPGALEAGDH
ncbi:MAG: hypothetical protein HOQ45_11925 [Nocardioidaceae bacterium]|nr:hypothetical protein [Nocardioidaceae bacterium]